MSLLTGNAGPYKHDIIRRVLMEVREHAEVSGEVLAVEDRRDALFERSEYRPQLLVMPLSARVRQRCHTAGCRCRVR